MMTRSIPKLALALCLGAAGAAFAAPGSPAAGGKPAANVPLTKQAYEAAKSRIDAQYRADQKACKALEDDPREVCDAQAEGRAKAEKAQLEARYQPSPEAEKKAKNATAEANYAVAKAKCEALKGKAESRCIKEAKAAREAAIRQAKVEKVEETGGIFSGHASGHKPPKPASPS